MEMSGRNFVLIFVLTCGFTEGKPTNKISRIVDQQKKSLIIDDDIDFSPKNGNSNNRASDTTENIMRVRGILDADLRKRSVNRVPFPRVHFRMPGLAPLSSRDSQQYLILTVPELTNRPVDPALIGISTTLQDISEKLAAMSPLIKALLRRLLGMGQWGEINMNDLVSEYQLEDYEEIEEEKEKKCGEKEEEEEEEEEEGEEYGEMEEEEE